LGYFSTYQTRPLLSIVQTARVLMVYDSVLP